MTKFHWKKALLCFAFLPFSCACAWAIPIVPDAVTKQDINQALDTKSASDYLVDMARATNINVIADVTEFPVGSTVVSYPSTSGAIAGLKGERAFAWKPSLINVMGDFVAQKKLSTLRADERTFLFWSEPDPRSLLAFQASVTETAEAARFAEAVAADKAAGVPEADVISGEVSDERLRTILYGYLETQFGWKGSAAERNDKVDLRVPLNDLPPGLRALILLDLRKGLTSEHLRPLPDNFLDTAEGQVTLSEGQDRTEVSLVYLVAKEEGVETRSGIDLDVSSDALANLTAADAEIAVPIVEPPAPFQIGEKDTLLNSYRGISQETTDPVLDADASLQSLISLEVKRLPLRELLVQMKQQAGVGLNLGEAAPADKLITARVEKMPLSQLMGVLARVYGVKWSKEEGANYTMRGNDEGELHLKLLQVGDIERYLYRFLFYVRPDRDKEKVVLARAIIQQVGKEALRSPEGVPLSALTHNLKARAWQFVKEPSAGFKATALYHTNLLLNEQIEKKGLVLQFAKQDGRSYRSPYAAPDVVFPTERLTFSVQSADGQILLPVFLEFLIPVAKPGERDVAPPSRRR